MGKKFFKRTGFISSRGTQEIVGSWWRVSGRFGFFTKSVSLKRVLTDLRRNGIKSSYTVSRARTPFGRIPPGQMFQIMGAAGFSMVEQLPNKEIPRESDFVAPRAIVGNKATFSRGTRFYIARISDWRLVGKMNFEQEAVFRDVVDSSLELILQKWKRGVEITTPPIQSSSRKAREDGFLELRRTVPIEELSWGEANRVLMNSGYTLIPAEVVEILEVFKEEKETVRG